MDYQLIQQLTESNEILAQSNQALFLSIWALIAGLSAVAFILGTRSGV